MNPDKTIIQKYICTPMSIEALCIIDKAWEQPKCPSTNELKKKIGCLYIHTYTHICNGILHSYKKE